MNSSRFFGGILCAPIACMLTGCGEETALSESADEPQLNQAKEGAGTQTAEKPTKYHTVTEENGRPHV